MATQSVLDEVDADFNIHTSYHTDFFLLRTRVLVNGENATITSVKEGSYEDPVMSFCHGGSTISTKLWSIANTISPILHKCGIYHVDTFYYEKSPLFHVTFSSESCLKSFLLEIGDVIHAIELGIQSVISPYLKSTSHETESPQQLAIEIQPDLFLVSPNLQETKGAELHLVTAENYSTCVTCWKDSKLFDFEFLYKSEEKALQYTSEIPDVSEVDSTPLDLSDLFDVTSELSPIATNWKSVGAALQLKSDILVNIDTRCTGNPRACLSGIVKEWLKRNYNVEKYGEPTWQRLVEVVVHPTGGANTALAMEIAMRHKVGVLPSPEGGVKPCGRPQQEIFGGYECDFVEPPTSAFQTECPICRLILREPFQCKYCGKCFCHSCSKRIQTEHKPCPTCNKTNFEVFPDNGLKHSLNQLQVLCPHSNNGCRWTGELGELEHHLREVNHSSIAIPPRITAHPHDLKDTVPDKFAMLTVQVTGTEPLKYQWEHKIEEGSEEWQLCDVESFPGASSSTLIIPSVQKSNEGSYRCTVSNCAGSETSESATLTVAQRPKITHPEELKNTMPGKPVSFTVKATGTEPLTYQWQWKPVEEGVSSGEWQNLSSGGSVQGADTATLTYFSMESCSEGLYRCVVTNIVGEEISHYTNHIIGKITELSDLVNELSTVSQWYLLGIYLGLHSLTLDTINADYKTTTVCRMQMLFEWQKHVIPTWSAVVKALVGIGRERLASHLATKYGISLPDTIDDKPLEELEKAKQKMAAGSEPTEVHYHGDEFQQLGRKLSEIEQLLKTSRDSQVPLNEDVGDLVSELSRLGKELQKLAQERENIESELEHKQHDFCLLSETKKDLAHSVEKCQLVEDKCQLLQRIINQNKDKLSKLQAELEEKHEEAKKLQKEKEKLTILYSAEKEEAKKLVQITLSDRDEMKQQLIVTKEELAHKSQQIAACNSRISDLSKEIEFMATSLQEKEAAVAQLESELHLYQKPASNPKLLSNILTLTTEITELRQTLQEAEYQKQQSSLEKTVAVQGVEAKKKAEMQLHRYLDEPPKVTDHPKSLKDAVLYEPVTFSIEATGTEPLYHQWEHKTRDGNGEWQSCDLETFPGAKSSTLTISSVQKLKEGSYRCTVSNLAGRETSECAILTVAERPRITTHPQEVKDAVPGKLVTFSIEATGTEPLSYQWQYEAGSEGWHLYDVEKSPGANSSTLTIPRVKKLNEGSYYCIVSNCAGSETSKYATLSLAKPPRITTHPKDLVNIVPGQQVVFTVQATGTKPLSYQWEYNPDMEGWSEEWQPCSGSNTDTLTIPSVQKSNEGSYHCVVSNCAGSRTSKAAKLFDVVEPPIIITHPKDSTYTDPGQQVLFTVQATGTKPLSYQWEYNPDTEGWSEEWQPCSGSNTDTLTIPSVQKSNEGSYLCVVSNCAGSRTSKPAKLKLQLITTEEQSEHKSLQTAASNSRINQLTENVEALSSSLQEKEVTVAQLESELQSYQKPASNSNHLSAVNALTTEIVELTQKLQEAEYQKQQASLERDAAIQETKEKMFEKHSQLGPIQGVEVIGVTEFTVPTQGGCFEWKGYGLKLHVPEESLPSGMEEARVNIRASLSGQFQLPEDSDLLSPVFWISAPCKFIKPVTLEIQHCALREDERVLSDLNFVSAKRSQSILPYRFKHLDGGVFTKHSSYGSIQLSHFCGMGVGGKKSTPRLYCAHLYHTMKHLHDWRFYLAITRDLEAQITAMKRHYSQHFARWDSTAKFRFEGTEIILETPKDGKITEGWKITPIFYPKIAKIEADEFGEGKSIPQCELMIEWKGESKTPVRLVYKLIMKGASEPDNYLHLVLDPAEAPVNRTQDGTYVSREHSTNPRKPKLKELTDALYYKVDDKWKILGIHLGLEERLDSIEENCKQDSKKCLLEILRTWLKQVDPPPTWTTIIEAVDFLGEKPLGRELQEKYIQ